MKIALKKILSLILATVFIIGNMGAVHATGNEATVSIQTQMIEAGATRVELRVEINNTASLGICDAMLKFEFGKGISLHGFSDSNDGMKIDEGKTVYFSNGKERDYGEDGSDIDAARVILYSEDYDNGHKGTLLTTLIVNITDPNATGLIKAEITKGELAVIDPLSQYKTRLLDAGFVDGGVNIGGITISATFTNQNGSLKSNELNLGTTTADDWNSYDPDDYKATVKIINDTGEDIDGIDLILNPLTSSFDIIDSSGFGPPLDDGEFASFTIAPKPGLPLVNGKPHTYTSVITISNGLTGEGAIERNITVSFRVNDANYILGDIDENGYVELEDVLLVARVGLGGEDPAAMRNSGATFNEAAADVDFNGYIELEDVLRIARVGLGGENPETVFTP